MNFYEELGVPPDAPLLTIRDAYRNVARLLHPDAQTDPVLKESAEGQMKRLNHLFDILADPARRRRYDQELGEFAERQATVFIQAPTPADPFDRSHSGTLVWLSATVVCATFIIWLAARESSSSPAVYPLPSSFSHASGAQAHAGSAPPARLRAAATVRPATPPANPGTVEPHDDELRALRGQLLAANAGRELLEKQMAAGDAERKAVNLANLTPAPLVAPVAPLEISLPAILPPAAPPSLAEPRWAGSWAYHPSRAQKKDNALFPPEFIEAVIAEDNGRIRGQYHARFKVADASISPDVDFRFEGNVSGQVGRLSWIGGGGAKGEVQLKLVSGTTLEIVWSASALGKSMGLASGTSVLTRKN